MKLIKSFLITLAFALIGQAAQTQETGLSVELNKFEGVDGGCQAYFLFRNTTAQNFEGFEMSLAVLDSGGVIDRLLTIDAAPLPTSRTMLKLFAIPDLQCEAIGTILLYDIGVCKPQNEAEIDCFAILSLNSRTSVPLVK
jgi:hypothetical protein